MKVGNRMKGGRREDRINERFEKMVAKINKLESENRRLKNIILKGDFNNGWWIPDPISPEMVEKSNIMHDIRERAFK